MLEELDSLDEVLGAEVLSRGFTAPSDWDKEFDSLLEKLNMLCEELTSPGEFLNSLGAAWGLLRGSAATSDLYDELGLLVEELDSLHGESTSP